MARIPIKQNKSLPKENKEISESLSAEKRQLSIVTEQRNALSKTLKGIEKGIADNNKLYKKIQEKVLDENRVLKEIDAEIQLKYKQLKAIRGKIEVNKDEIRKLVIIGDQKQKSIKDVADQMLSDFNKKRDEKILEISDLKKIKDEIKCDGDKLKKSNEAAVLSLKSKENAIKDISEILDERGLELKEILSRIDKLKGVKTELKELESKKENVKGFVREVEKTLNEIQDEIAKRKEENDKEGKALSEKKKLLKILDNKKATIIAREKDLDIKAKTLQKHFNKHNIPIKVI